MPGYLGRLHGPFLPGNHKYCLRFYYLLFEKVDSALVLYIYDEHNVALEKVWSLYDSSGSVWNEVEITYMKPMTTKVGSRDGREPTNSGRTGIRWLNGSVFLFPS